ncbi:uncharacterized protein LOC129724165 [Wyeomyia smithii]|uniref:uncharacterized protein LOC129724165 n=1 Tax=Wyeomyia smithii TaxID=174621 RepID=UPI002467FADA|nr:uncharacterized protein LOC129724165 [Wyeomyia smithii]
MVSFDVTALFPSVPVKEAINLLEDWLLSQQCDNPWKTKVRSYLKLTRLCMEDNYFSFRGKFYKQTKGAPMGNPLSPFLCELFMAHLENKLNEKDCLPDRWWRYVDEFFCILQQGDLESFLGILNGLHKNIQFTLEIEQNNRLPFLDVVVVNNSNHFEFEIFRKPTYTKRVIPNTSNHSSQHKMASFHHMIHRMESLPLSNEGKKNEMEYIFDIGEQNGYNRRTIQAIYDKKKRTQHRKSHTTLTPLKEDRKRVVVEYDVSFTRQLRKKFRKFGIDIIYSSRNNQMKTKLGSTKDTIDKLHRAGVYKVACPHCDKVYIGQTKRNLDIRFKEHTSELVKAKKDSEKGITHHFRSKIAEHIFHEDHAMTTDNISLVRSVTSPWKLDVAESLEIFKQNPATISLGFLNFYRKLPDKARITRPHISLPNSSCLRFLS